MLSERLQQDRIKTWSAGSKGIGASTILDIAEMEEGHTNATTKQNSMSTNCRVTITRR
jgi:hypothetical protein